MGWLWFWKKKPARRRREKKVLSREELWADDARRDVLKTCRDDEKFRKDFVLSAVGTQEPSEALRACQESLVAKQKLDERVHSINSPRRMSVLDKILASEETLNRFAEFELLAYYRKSGKTPPEQQTADSELVTIDWLSELPDSDDAGDESVGFDLAALIQNPFVKVILGIIAFVFCVRLLRFLMTRLALSSNQLAAGAAQDLYYVILIDGKPQPIPERQYKELQDQGKIVAALPPPSPPPAIGEASQALPQQT
jgi:hypothetical protein